CNSQFRGQLRTAAGEHQTRLAGWLVHDADIAPADAAFPARAQRLEHRLLAGKSSRQPLGAPLSGNPIRIGLLDIGEAAFEEALAMLLEHAHDACDFDEVDAMRNDSHGRILRVVKLRWGQAKSSKGTVCDGPSSRAPNTTFLIPIRAQMEPNERRPFED